jgi:hypothetical protein
VGDRATVASALNMLSLLALGDDDFGKAHALLEECLAIVGELGDEWFLMTMHCDQAWLALVEADYATARDLLGRVITFCRDRGMPASPTGLPLMYVACLAVAQDQPEKALRLGAKAAVLVGTPVPLWWCPAWTVAERRLEEARQSVVEAACAAATAEGQAMSQAQAIACALEVLAPA